MRAGLLLSCFLMLGNVLHAQGVGAEAGVSMSANTMYFTGTKAKALLRPGFKVGIIFDQPITSKLSYQYGLFYNAKGTKVRHESDITNSNGLAVKQYITGQQRIDYIEAPLNLLYNHKLKSGHIIVVGGGPYIACAFGGWVMLDREQVASSTSATLSIGWPATVGNDPTENDFKIFDMGFNANVAYELKSGVFARLNATYGVLDISPSPDNMHNYGAAFTVGYMIR